MEGRERSDKTLGEQARELSAITGLKVTCEDVLDLILLEPKFLAILNKPKKYGITLRGSSLDRRMQVILYLSFDPHAPLLLRWLLDVYQRRKEQQKREIEIRTGCMQQ